MAAIVGYEVNIGWDISFPTITDLSAKQFYFVPNENCNCSECPYMKRNNLENLRDCLDTLQPRIELSDEMIRRAALPIDRMLAVK